MKEKFLIHIFYTLIIEVTLVSIHAKKTIEFLKIGMLIAIEICRDTYNTVSRK